MMMDTDDGEMTRRFPRRHTRSTLVEDQSQESYVDRRKSVMHTYFIATIPYNRSVEKPALFCGGGVDSSMITSLKPSPADIKNYRHIRRVLDPDILTPAPSCKMYDRRHCYGSYKSELSDLFVGKPQVSKLPYISVEPESTRPKDDSCWKRGKRYVKSPQAKVEIPRYNFKVNAHNYETQQEWDLDISYTTKKRAPFSLRDSLALVLSHDDMPLEKCISYIAFDKTLVSNMGCLGGKSYRTPEYSPGFYAVQDLRKKVGTTRSSMSLEARSNFRDVRTKIELDQEVRDVAALNEWTPCPATI